MMRRLGFRADDLYFSVHPSGNAIENGVAISFGKPVIYLELRTQGKVFHWLVGPTDLALKEIEPAYHAACTMWNSASEEDINVEASFAFRQAVPLVAKLQELGFKFSDDIRD